MAYGLRIVNGASFLTQKEWSTFQFGVEATWRSVLAWINKTGISSSTSLLPMWKKGLPFSWGLKETTPNIRKIAEVYPLLFWKRARWPHNLYCLNAKNHGRGNGTKQQQHKKNWDKIRFIDQRKAVTAIKCNKYCLLNISASHIWVPGHLSSNFSYQSEF